MNALTQLTETFVTQSQYDTEEEKRIIIFLELIQIENVKFVLLMNV